MVGFIFHVSNVKPVQKFDQLTLQTERLRLRPLRESDAQGIFAIRSNPTVMRYHSSPPWTSIDQAVVLIADALIAMQSGEHMRLGLELADKETLIGVCGLFHFEQQCRRAEMGYELHLDAWGKGYMNEALQAVLTYGFSNLGLNRVEADIHPDNVGSAKVVERLGFKKEGHLRERWIVGDEVSDSTIYGLLLSDWRSTRD